MVTSVGTGFLYFMIAQVSPRHQKKRPATCKDTGQDRMALVALFKPAFYSGAKGTYSQPVQSMSSYKFRNCSGMSPTGCKYAELCARIGYWPTSFHVVGRHSVAAGPEQLPNFLSQFRLQFLHNMRLTSSAKKRILPTNTSKEYGNSPL